MIKFKALKTNFKSSDCYENDIITTELEEYRLLYKGAVSIGAFQFLIVTEGSLELNIDYVPYKINGSSIVVMRSSRLIRAGNFSENFQGKLIVVSPEFLEKVLKNEELSNILKRIDLWKFPHLKLEEEEVLLLEDCFYNIKRVVVDQDKFLKRCLLQNVVENFLIEMSSIYLKRKGRTKKKFHRTRGEELMEMFLQLMKENIRKEHSVAFYAEKLFITTTYLTIITKESVGKTAAQCIKEALLEESKKLLSSAAKVNARQVSEILHFCNPSAFGKFFREMTGKTPHQFKEEI